MIELLKTLVMAGPWIVGFGLIYIVFHPVYFMKGNGNE